MHAGQVLLIVDDKALLGVMATAFELVGYDVRSAQDGAEGLTLFEAAPADLVVIDLTVPVAEGLQTIAALKTTQPSVKVIAISAGIGSGPEEAFQLADEIGADAALSKPFAFCDLLAFADLLIAVARTSPEDPVGLSDRCDDAADTWADVVMLARLLVALGARGWEPED